MSDEVITAVTKPEAVAMAEIHAIRGLTDAVATLTRQVERMNAKVDDVRERVIKIEAREYERKIETLQKRLSDLEGAQQRRTGMASVGGWFSRAAPWLIGMASALGAYLMGARSWA